MGSTLPVLTPVRVGHQDKDQWESVIDVPALRTLTVIQHALESLVHQVAFVESAVQEEQQTIPACHCAQPVLYGWTSLEHQEGISGTGEILFAEREVIAVIT